MGNNLRKTALGAIGGIVVILLLLFILPIDVVYEVSVDTRTYPSKEWKLIQEGSQYRTEEVSYVHNDISSGKSFVFDRGDVIDLDFHEDLKNGMVVDKDEILLQFSSMMHNLKIQRALNEIEVQESRKRAGRAAMKIPLYREAQDGVELAESNLQLQQANHGRLAQLLEDGVISQAELDAQVNRLEVARQELAIAKRRVDNASFEQKPEDIAVFNTVINTVDKELDVLLAQQGAYTVRSPFEGEVSFQPEPGVILSVKDTATMSLLFPFPIDQRQFLNSTSKLELETENGNMNIPFHLKDEVAYLQGDQHCLGVALLKESQIIQGEMRLATIVCDTISLRDYIYRKLL